MTATVLNENSVNATGHADMGTAIRDAQKALADAERPEASGARSPAASAAGSSAKRESDVAPFLEIGATGTGKMSVASKFIGVMMVAGEDLHASRRNNGFMLSGTGKGGRNGPTTMEGDNGGTYADKVRLAAERKKQQAQQMKNGARQSKFGYTAATGASAATAGKPRVSNISGLTVADMGRVMPNGRRHQQNIETAEYNKDHSIIRLSRGLGQGNEDAETKFRSTSQHHKQQILKM